MKVLFPLLLVVSVFSTDLFSQQKQSESRPQAYQVGNRNAKTAQSKIYIARSVSDNRPKAYQVTVNNRAEISRPRIYQSEPIKTASSSAAVNAYALERRAFQLINERRTKNGLSPLKWSDDVARIARLHSQNMANYNFFSHAGIDGLLVNDRADYLGINKWQAIGENIAYNQGFDNPVEFAVERWMQSPKHRDNLLSSRWKESGIGVAVAKNGTYYFTEVFLLRK